MSTEASNRATLAQMGAITRWTLLDLAARRGWPAFTDDRGVTFEGRQAWTECPWVYASDRRAAYAYLDSLPATGADL